MSHITHDDGSRTLPESLPIPIIDGEMVHLRPSTLEDLTAMDAIDAYHNSSLITGRPEAVERAVVHEWVQNSVLWSSTNEKVITELRERLSFKHVVAWTMETISEESYDGTENKPCIIGMIFLVNVSGWTKSARMHVVLGRNFRGRGYSRDAMPRILTYAFAPRPVGLDLYRIWVAIPEQNTRTHSIYTSLGFVHEGVSRKAIWNDELQKYEDLHVFATLADEYDPIRSLDSFGMHLIMDNPGVKEALPDVQCDSQCSGDIRPKPSSSSITPHDTEQDNTATPAATDDVTTHQSQPSSQQPAQAHSDMYDMLSAHHAENIAKPARQQHRQNILETFINKAEQAANAETDTSAIAQKIQPLDDSLAQDDEATVWPYQHIYDVNAPRTIDETATRSPKRAWWRTMGEKRQRTTDRAAKKDN